MTHDNHEKKTVRQTDLTEFGLEAENQGQITFDKFRQEFTTVK